jgi:hypothetical protein
MGEDEDRCVERRLGPRPFHLGLAYPVPNFAHDLGTVPDRTAGESNRRRRCHLSPRRVANIRVQPFTGVTEMCVVALTFAGAEAVERDGEVVDADE